MPPVISTADVTRLAHDGRGIAKVDGKTVFIAGALPDEQVTFTYTQRKNQFDQGNVLDVLVPSPHRVEPKCEHANICGGCRLQHMDAESQVDSKQAILLEQLIHFGKVTPPKMLAPPLTASVWGYRRKARLSAKYVSKKERFLLGFHEKEGRYVADLTRCEVLHPAIGLHLVELREVLSQLSIDRALPQIEVAVGDDAIVLVLRHLEPLTDADKKLLSEFGEQHKMTWYLQSGNASTVVPLNKPAVLSYALPAYNLTLTFSPLDFVQINDSINQLMVQQAMEWLDIKATDRVLDLFCGLGNFSLPLARLAEKVVGVEGDNEMVKRARHNAELNQLNNTEFYAADLSKSFSDMPWAKQRYNKILLDPARMGALEIVQQIQMWKATHILYVSCNPATFARDAGELVKQGYKLKRLGVLDMFPHTHHVEAMGLFVKL